MASSKIFILILLFISFIKIYCQINELVSITRSTFCFNLSNREPINSISQNANINLNGSLFFWMEFVGHRRAFEILEANGELKIWHEWRRGITVTDRIMVGITQEKWIENQEQIRLEFRNRGFFTWRTFSFKKITTSSRRKVKIYDDNGNEISPQMDSQINIFLN